MSCDQKTMADFGVRFSGIVKSLIVEILVGFRANNVTCFAQRVPVRFSRSSKSAMLFFPVAGANFTGCAGIQTFKSERFEFFFCDLVGTDQTLHVGRDGQAFSFSLLANPSPPVLGR